MSATILGNPEDARTLIVVDHASSTLPPAVDLGLPAEAMKRHIAFDIGTYEIADILSDRVGYAAICAKWSRLLVDTNRCPNDAAVIPVESDGHPIAANRLCKDRHSERLARYHVPYHDAVSDLIETVQPAFLLFLHSFTPRLTGADADARPWEVGLLYNEDLRGADIAMAFFRREGFCVGDQQPYSGLIYNYSFVRHAESRGLPYILLEIRQDLIGDAAGQARFADLTHRLTDEILERLA